MSERIDNPHRHWGHILQVTNARVRSVPYHHVERKVERPVREEIWAFIYYSFDEND